MALVVNNPPVDAGDVRDADSIPGSGKIPLGQVRFPWRKAWQPTPALLPGESRGQRSLVGYSPWGHTELDTTERLSIQAQGGAKILHFYVAAILLV